MVIEDEPIARAFLVDLLANEPLTDVVAEAGDGVQALQIAKETRPDLIFLDIELPGLNGIELLNRLTYKPLVVMTTAYPEHALESFDHRVVDYLVKPFEESRVAKTIRRLTALQQLPHSDSPGPILLQDGDRFVPIDPLRIQRLQASGDYVRVVTEERTFLTSGPLKQLLERLDCGSLIRVHRSHAVNLRHVEAFERFDATRIQVLLEDGSVVVGSRSWSREFRRSNLRGGG